MRSQACEPCAKRKVRCDKDEPCSNCKRRKQDHCIYLESTPIDRIRTLEALVRDLGGNPEGNHQPAVKIATGGDTSTKPQLFEEEDKDTSNVNWGNSKDSIVLEEDGQSFYLESRAWHGWLGYGQEDGENKGMGAGNPFHAQSRPNVLQGLFCSRGSIDLVARHPSIEDATFIWEAFDARIDPVVRIAFKWELRQLRTASLHLEQRKHLKDSQNAFIFSCYLISALSLTDDDCQQNLRQTRDWLLTEFQMLCEEALFRTNIFCMNDIMVLKTLTFYMMACVDRFNNHSLWSLMGLTIRNAERLGIHRDGTFLGLSPAQTEERRRLWWQLQHLDLFLAIRSGLTPLTLMADWDVKLPLNIEDDDINLRMKNMPEERKGSTSMSYCLYTYWVIDQQRQFFQLNKSRFHLSWQSNQSLAQQSKDSLIQKLEEGLNQKFLQSCDPLKPIDVLTQLSARSLICGTRLRTLQPPKVARSSEKSGGEHRSKYLNACLQCLDYNIATNSQPSLKIFRWLTKEFFPWQSFSYVLVEALQQNDVSMVQRIWDVLTDIYATNPALSKLSEDRRYFRASEMVIAAWRSREVRAKSEETLSKPGFVAHLETRLLEYSTKHVQSNSTNSALRLGSENVTDSATTGPFLSEVDMDAFIDLDFQDIDWSFWNSSD